MRLAKSLGVEVREIPNMISICYQVTVRTKASSCVQVLSILKLHGSATLSPTLLGNGKEGRYRVVLAR